MAGGAAAPALRRRPDRRRGHAGDVPGGVAGGGRFRGRRGERLRGRLAVDDRRAPARRRVPPRARDTATPLATEPVAPAAEDEALSDVVGDEVGVALARLAPELRQVLQAMVVDGLTVRETATLLGRAGRHGQDTGPPGPPRDAGGTVMNQHASPDLLRRYADGDPTLTADVVWAVEVHLESCADCRARLATEATRRDAAGRPGLGRHRPRHRTRRRCAAAGGSPPGPRPPWCRGSR